MKKDYTGLDFEISFYEKLVREKEGFVEALIPLGDAYTKRGLYQKGLKVDKRLAKLRPYDPMVYYNLACSYSLVKMIDEAIATLKKAIKLGYTDSEFMERDPDLNNLKTDERYKRFCSQLSSKQNKEVRKNGSSN